ncbi:MAG TPA: protein kinase [Thermoanaerobaculia bacterium]|nr:protein kinase [Thermoanaerobaculia bacterium]
MIGAGTRLGPYEILSPLGAGGMGEVWRARDSRLAREVAIKVLPASFSADAERLRRFEQEAKAAGLLNHPNITAVYDIGTHEGAPYVVQELLEGETLRSELAGGRFSLRKAIDYARQIAQGLAAAHEKGIVHRDLKPENLFVTRDGRIKILDFGLAKLTRTEEGSQVTNLPTATAGTEPGVVLGTLGYMSPEQVKGKSTDARSDIFAFGAILYEMLSGRHAFHADSAAETMSAILREDPPDLSLTNQNISPGLDRIVRHCLEKNPEQRFHSAHDLAFDLEELSGVSSPERPISAVSAARAVRPRRLLIAALVLLALAVSYLAGRLSHARKDQGPATFARKTFQPQTIFVARFAPDGKTIVYSSALERNVPELFSIRPEYPEPRPLGLPETHLLSVSSQGELLILTRARWINHRFFSGTLARMALGGGAPREVVENVREADWSPDGSSIAIIREVDGKDRLEFPIGKVLYQTGGYVSDLRVSPRGDRIAFFDHPIRYDDRGTLAVVDRAGKKTVLSGDYGAEEGLAWAPGGEEVLFSAGENYSRFQVQAVTLSGRKRVVLESAGGLTIQDISREGRWLATRDDHRTGFLVKAPGEKAERDLSWLGNSLVPILSRDGKTLLFTDESESAGPNYMVCLRKTDGSPVVRLGEGRAADLSPDGSRVIAWVPASPPYLRLYPTGPGEARQLERGNLESYESAAWFPDGQRLLVCGHEPGRAARCYEQQASGGASRPVTPEGASFGLPSPDGRFVLARNAGRWTLYPLAGGPPVPLGLTQEDLVIRWSPDGRSLWIRRRAEVPAQIERFDLQTGRREPMEKLAPQDSAILGIFSISLADDPSVYVYNYWQEISHLFVVEGAR